MPLIQNPNPDELALVLERLEGTDARRRHLEQFSYANQPLRPGELRKILLQRSAWIYATEADGPIGFMVYPTPIPLHPNSFGMGIALEYCGRGHAKAALNEFVAQCPQLGLRELSGYCRNDNLGMIAVLKACGFSQVEYRDPMDQRTLHFQRPIPL
jgi:RimJ/RimL family protein N-acetyltransferase